MQKDYFKILQVPPGATQQEIRQAFRRLAMTYHPDKNVDDPSAAAQFNDVKEAYEVLTSPQKRERYLEERWYNQDTGRKRTVEIVTPVSILKLSLELEQYVSRLDVHRMNKAALSGYIDELISTDTIEKLKQFNDTPINRQIIFIILTAMKPLSLRFVTPLVERLNLLAGNDPDAVKGIKSFVLKHKKNFLWDKYKMPLMLLFTILICLLIFLTGK
jgi:hypothetical protein